MPDNAADRIAADVVRFIASTVLHNHGVAQRLRLGPSDSQFLTLLQVHGPLTPGRLAELSGLTSGTVSGVLDRLEQAGLARRDPDPSDRRKVVVTLDADAAAERVAPEYADHGERLRTVLAERGPDELEVIAAFFADLLDGSDQPADPAVRRSGRRSTGETS